MIHWYKVSIHALSQIVIENRFKTLLLYYCQSLIEDVLIKCRRGLSK